MPADIADPNCAPPASSGLPVATYTSVNDWGYDMNLRHVHMRAKYGLDPQYPVQRYVMGLTSLSVPDRTGEYPPGATNYAGLSAANAHCANPLFAASLPDGTNTDPATLCNLRSRPLDHVVYLHIGGVPYELLHFKPNDPQASALSDADWTKILGKDPLRYDYTGIDPHMIESSQPRTGTNVGIDVSGTGPLAATSATSTSDPVSGREWVTDQQIQPNGHVLPVDREYACIFRLPAPRDCTQSYNQSSFCDCPYKPNLLSHDQTPPVCDENTPTMQVAAKAYPTIRELLLAKLLGSQGVVSSICPPHVTDNATGNDPLYGYRPAVSALVERIRLGLK
jgi:hypothetical protein